MVCLLAALTAAPAWGQGTPLVVGAVRDQNGAPVAGALVRAVGTGNLETASTDSNGTFALRASGVSTLEIACAFCRTQRVSVVPGVPVVAIVHRYAALLAQTPSPSDLASLPYAHVESALALRPFTVLEDTSALVPGASLSDRGLARGGGLVLDAGVPNYDPVTNASPFLTTPQFYARGVDVRPPFDAFQYGDRAGGGTFAIDPIGEPATSATALGGDDAVFNLAESTPRGGAALGSSSNGIDLRKRIDADWTIPASSDSLLTLAASIAQGRVAPSGGSYLESSFGALRARYDRVRENDVHVQVLADRGTYDLQAGRESTALWSDVAAEIGIAPATPVGFFADLGLRSSSGLYDAREYTIPLEYAAIEQQHADAGLRVVGKDYDLSAGIAAFDIGYRRGTLGGPPLRSLVASPAVDLQLAPGRRLSARLGLAQTFRLPTVLEAYANPPFSTHLPYDRNDLASATLSYTDLRRLRVDFTAATQAVHDLDWGNVNSVGIAATWQFAPAFSARVWELDVRDSTISNRSYVAETLPKTATVGSLWITYENDARVRVDAIWRRDLLDNLADEHLDGSISAPLAPNVRWFIGTERYRRSRYVDLGIRFTR
jgi:hypothetical protein